MSSCSSSHVVNAVSVRMSSDYKVKERMAPYRRAGHMDAMAGRGFHPEYDRWDYLKQLSYERGRMCVANLRNAKLPVPQWQAGVVRPRGYNTAINHAAELVGSPFGVRQENDPALSTDHLIPLSLENVY